MNAVLELVQEWCSRNEVILNAKKSQVLNISTLSKNRPQIGEIRVNGTEIEQVEKARNLGHIMNNRLSQDDHVIKVCNDISRTVYMLRKSQSFLLQRARLILVKALIIPKLLNYSLIDGFCNKKLFNRLRVAFNKAVRYVYFSSRSLHLKLRRIQRLHRKTDSRDLSHRCFTPFRKKITPN